METNNQDEINRQESRSDYGTKNEKDYSSSSAGRVLRPRRKRISSDTPDNSGYGRRSSGSYEKVNYNSDNSEERRSSGAGQHSGYSSDRRGGSYGDRRSSYGNSDRRGGSYGDRRSSYGSSDRREGSYGERRSSYGSSDRRSGSYGEHRSSYGSGERREGSYGEHRSSYGSGERRSGSYGERRSSYGSGDRREGSYGERRSSYGSGDRREGSYGERRSSYGSSDRRSGSYGDRRSSYGSSDRRGGSYGDRRSSYGSSDRRPFAKRDNGFRSQNNRRFDHNEEFQFNETDEAGINKMLSRKAVIDNNQMSDNDTVQTPIQEEMRLNKYIANSGVCSRREADNYIQAGVVTVNGTVVTELGTKINVTKDDVRFNGERLKGEEKVYLVMNKPKGFVTTASDPHADRTVMDLLKECKFRVFPVGRLDKNTTGILMFTNDGEIAEKLTHPSYNKKKIYQVILDKPLSQEDHDKIIEGIPLNDGEIKADELEFIDPEDHRKLGIEIHSGKNRIVRRIFEATGYDVRALDRVYFAGLTKKGLKRGEWRNLTEGEVNILKMGAYV
ncbi:MAG: pseudouridine synthase [Bacteroidales bacterium]|nr:pseudouridine synthase [Bacteroidales bacterium]MCI1785564.1 pseudouridine synthase [Bacteroidales bacterium]